jgi:hypothetical protein
MKNRDFAFVLRFASLERTESQIAIIVRPNGESECTRYTSRGQRQLPSLDSVVQSQTAPTVPPDILPERVSFAARELYFWQENFFVACSRSEGMLALRANRFHKVNEVEVVLHGDLYRVWYSDFNGSQYWSLLGDGIADKQDFGQTDDLIRWMNTVRTKVESKLKQKEIQRIP